MKLYATFFFFWLALIVALVVYAGLYSAVARASIRAFPESPSQGTHSVTPSDEAKLRKYIVSRDALLSFTEDLIARAEAVGASASVTPAPAFDDRFARFVISTSGDFDTVMRSIGVIEYAPYVLSIDALTVGVGERDVWRSELTFSVGIHATP